MSLKGRDPSCHASGFWASLYSCDSVFKRDSHDDLVVFWGIKTKKIVVGLSARAVHELFHSWSKSLFAFYLSRDRIDLNFA